MPRLPQRKPKRLVISGVLAAFVLVMSLSKPWEVRTEILGSIIFPELNPKIVLKKPDQFKAYVRKKNKETIKVLINGRIQEKVQLEKIGLKIESPAFEEQNVVAQFFDEVLAHTVFAGEQGTLTADLKLDHDAFEKYLDRMKAQVEVESQKPEVMWTEQRKWHFEGLKKGTAINEDLIGAAIQSLVNDLQEGKKEPALKLKTKKIRPEISAEERKVFHSQYESVQKLIEKPITFKVENEATVLDLNSSPEYILITDDGAVIHEEAVKTWVQEDFGKKYYHAPGKITIVGKKEYRPGLYKAITEGDSTEGQEVNADEIMVEFSKALATPDRVVKVPLEDLPIEVYSNLENTKYDLLSVGWSDYSTGNHEDRVHNFSTGLKRVDNMLIDRGQLISLNKAIGSFDSEFVKGLGIVGTTAQPVVGGGICQAATTFFRALVNLGVPLKMHKNHSWDLSYYRTGGYGLDATIFPEQGLDIKANNDIDSQLYFHAYIRPKKLEALVLVYGKGDGRKVTLKPEQENRKYVPGPKTIKWTQLVELPTGELRQHEIISTYKK